MENPEGGYKPFPFHRAGRINCNDDLFRVVDRPDVPVFEACIVVDWSVVFVFPLPLWRRIETRETIRGGKVLPARDSPFSQILVEIIVQFLRVFCSPDNFGGQGVDIERDVYCRLIKRNSCFWMIFILIVV